MTVSSGNRSRFGTDSHRDRKRREADQQSAIEQHQFFRGRFLLCSGFEVVYLARVWAIFSGLNRDETAAPAGRNLSAVAGRRDQGESPAARSTCAARA